MRKLLLLIVFLMLIPGCVYIVRFHPIIEPDKAKEMLYVDGNEVIFSEKDSTSIALYLHKKDEYELICHILYFNKTDSLLNVFPDHARVFYYYDNRKKMDSLYVYPSDIYMKKIRTMQQINNFALALSATAASYSSNTTTTTTGVIGGDVVNVTSTSSNPQTFTQSMLQVGNTIRYNNQIYAAANLATELGLVKRHTLWPNTYVEGNIIIKYKSSDRYRVEIPFGDDVHIVEFNAEQVSVPD